MYSSFHQPDDDFNPAPRHDSDATLRPSRQHDRYPPWAASIPLVQPPPIVVPRPDWLQPRPTTNSSGYDDDQRTYLVAQQAAAAARRSVAEARARQPSATTGVIYELGGLALERSSAAPVRAKPSKSSLRSISSGSSTRSKSSRPRSPSDDEAAEQSRKSRSRTVSFKDDNASNSDTHRIHDHQLALEIEELLLKLAPILDASVRATSTRVRDPGLTVTDFVRPSPDSLIRILDAYTDAIGEDPLLAYMRTRFNKVGPAICEALANDQVVRRNFLRGALEEVNAADAQLEPKS
ncbi:hypothetical protein JCM8208_003313 [Rhodotorula glutinis]